MAEQTENLPIPEPATQPLSPTGSGSSFQQRNGGGLEAKPFDSPSGSAFSVNRTRRPPDPIDVENSSASVLSPSSSSLRRGDAGRSGRRKSQTNFSHVYIRSLEHSSPPPLVGPNASGATGILPFVGGSRRPSVLYGTSGKIWLQSKFPQPGILEHDVQALPDPPISPPIDWLRPANARRGSSLPVRRSFVEPPPLGSPGKSWGRFDTVAEVLSRPQVSPQPSSSDRKTLAKHGGGWSPYMPISRLYMDSRLALQTPGPGNYGLPDPILSSKPSPFSKTAGGKFSTSRIESERLCKMKLSGQVPGPGYYDVENVFGLAKRIELGSMPRSQTRSITAMSYIDPEDLMLCVDPVEYEQRLVMSAKVPIKRMRRLGNTRFSRLNKETRAPHVRKFKEPEAQPEGSDSDSSFYGAEIE